jgi:effector-binding domain-containing protein
MLEITFVRMMIGTPRFEIRQAQHYAAIQLKTGRKHLGAEVPALLQDVLRFLTKNRIAPAGPPIIRYQMIGDDEKVSVEAGYPTSEPVGGGNIAPGTLPRGRYLSVVHQGPYTTIVDTTREFLAWAKENDVEFDAQEGPGGTVWKARVEHYLTDPADQPDPSKWETKLTFLTRG